MMHLCETCAVGVDGFDGFWIGNGYFIWRDSEDWTVFSMSGSDIFMQSSIQSSPKAPEWGNCCEERAGNVSVGCKVTKVEETSGDDADNDDEIMLP